MCEQRCIELPSWLVATLERRTSDCAVLFIYYELLEDIAAGDILGLLAERSLVTLTNVLDNCSLHDELDKIHGQEPDDIL